MAQSNNEFVQSGFPALPFFVNDHGLDALLSVTIASGTTVLSGGTIIGELTTSGKYTRYADGASDGSETARGILLNRIDPTKGDHLGSMMVHGVVRSGSVHGYDAAAAAELTKFIFV